jgi:hypothetical protein
MELNEGQEVRATRDIRRGFFGGGSYVRHASKGVVTGVNPGRQITYVVEFLTPQFFGGGLERVRVTDIAVDEISAVRHFWTH